MLQNILGAIGTSFDCLSAIILSLSFGYATLPTALAFIIGGIGMVVFHSACPLSVPTEVIILAGRIGKTERERACIGMYSGFLIFLFGLTGILGTIQNYVGDTIMSAIMAGVGIMIAMVAINLVKENPLAGGTSVGIAVVVYLLTGNLIYTIIACVSGAALVYNIVKRDEVKAKPKSDLSREKFRFMKPMFNKNVLRGTLGVTTLIMGAIVADGGTTSQLAGIPLNVDFQAIVTGIAGLLSSMFGGAPAGVIVSATATAPDPIVCGVMMMGILAILMLLRVVPKIARYIPSQGIAGILFTLGTFVIFPGNATAALSDNAPVAAVTMLVGAMVDPFFGMVAGVLLRLILGFIG